MARLAALQRDAEFAGEPMPSRIAVTTEVTKEAWEDETAPFKEEVKVALDREYELALVGWRASLADSPTKTPEEMVV